MISKLEIIQTYFQETSKSFNSIILKEREAKVARTTFQKALILSTKEEIGKTHKLFVSEQIKGDIILKFWKASLAKNKRITKDVNDNCQAIFDLLDKALLNIGRDNCLGLLGQINIGRHQLNFKENLDEIQIEISQIKVIDVTQINRWMVKLNLKLQTIEFTGKIIEDRLPELQRKFFIFEAKDIPEAPRVLVQFLGKCISCLKMEEGSSSTKKQSIILKVFITEITKKIKIEM